MVRISQTHNITRQGVVRRNPITSTGTKWIVMTMIDRMANHYKFWSAEEYNGNFTGRICYGRIGSRGVFFQYPDAITVLKKIREKQNEGYVINTKYVNTPFPTGV